MRSIVGKNEDQLSSLPEDVLSHILSLMPTIYAVRTCVLSKRWRHTWTFVTNLDFNVDHKADVSEFVDRVLERCKTSQLNSFRLGLFCYDSFQNSDPSKWINEAIRLNVCEIDIDIDSAEFPISLFACKTLTKLRLVLSVYDSNAFDISSPVIMLPALKTLDLCVCSKHSVNVFKLIHGCPVLETLSLNDDQHYYNFNIPTLKRLELRLSRSWSTTEVVLSVPNLEYLFVSGESCPHFVMEDLSSLVQATLVFHDFRDYHRHAELLNELSGVKSLSWSFSQVNYFSLSPLPKFTNLKHLELKGSSVDQWLLVIHILESSPELEHFSFEEPQESSWIEPQSVPTRMLSKLKTIKITKCKGRKCDLQFLEFMLGNAEVLKTLTIICGIIFGMEEEIELYGSLLAFPRASRFCEIHFVGKWLEYI